LFGPAAAWFVDPFQIFIFFFLSRRVSFIGFPFENRRPIRHFDIEHNHRIVILTSETSREMFLRPSFEWG
jgi:hypothetical protein